MSLRRPARVALALALLTAACSGSAEGGGAAAPGSSTSFTTAPASVGDPAAAQPPDPPTAPSVRAPSSSGKGTAAAAGKTPTTTAVSSGHPATATTAPGPTTTVPPDLPPEKCPDAKTCRRYGFAGNGTPYRWRIGADGRATIRYRINPTAATSVTPEQIEGAIQAAFAQWERAAPTLRFVYEGRTTANAVPGDGQSVIAFNHGAIEHTIPSGDAQGYLDEFDMLFSPYDWTWAPCRQADNSCVPHNVRDATGSLLHDLQSFGTHAGGHVIWGADMNDDELDRELTMHPNWGKHPSGARHWSTLALGDVLMARALYPCSCPLPPIYSP